VDSQASLVSRKNKNKRQMAGDSNPFIYGGGIPMTTSIRFVNTSFAESTSMLSAKVLTLVLASCAIVPTALAQGEEEAVEEIVVIATRLRADSVQDVPAAITAINSEAMERQQIENTSDMQFTVPNVSYSKGNFTTSAFQVRGIGNTAVGSTADSGVSVHVNDIPIESHRLYAVEFFDIETVSIMRGPQGTLFGRNATGGLINIGTNKPEEDFTASFEAELGDYNNRKFKGHINFPMGDMFSARIAGISTQRDGYTTNLHTGNDIDGRDMYSARGSLRFQPSDRTTFDLMINYMNDDSTRSRYQKKMCHRDPVGNLGCLGDRLEYELPNGMATLPSNLVTNVVLGDATSTDPLTNWGLSLFPLFPFAIGYDINANVPNPPDPRTVNMDFEPTYEAEDTLISLALHQAVGDYHELSVSVAYLDTSYRSRTDFDATVGAPIVGVPAAGIGLSPALPLFAPLTYGALYSGGSLPYSNISTSNLGILGLDILGSATNYFSYDQSNVDADQTTFEAILTSNYDGAWNYLFGAIYFDYEGSTDYNLAANTIDYFSAVAPIGLVGPIFDGAGVATSFFVNETDLYGLKTTGIFSEIYYDISDTVKLTLGLRYTEDEKRVRDRNLLLNSLLAGAPVPTPIGSSTAAGLPDYRIDKETFSDTTGRFVVDWQLGESTMAYGSYARGYKGGGFNPPFDPAAFPTATRTFEPETINAYEIGTKSVFEGVGLTLNLSAFYYDYEGLQVARIVNRTSFNENVDAEITGFEADFVWSPIEDFVVNGTISLLDTEIGNVNVADPRDPAAGIAEATVVKDIQSSENCVILWNGGPDPALVLPGFDPTFALLPFSSCDDLRDLMPVFNANMLPYSYTDAVEKNLSGNPLAGSPESSFSIGAQYTFRIGDSLELTPRADYYRQSDSQGRIYNSPIDRIESWDVVNAQITLAPDDYRWYFKVFVQNLNDDDNITAIYLDPAAVGLSTNVFLMEPRRYGATFGISFE
jgi:outer membrane receptor protein involved in Fe transport